MMEYSALKLVYFSPTGTTKRIVEEIASGMDLKRVEAVDCTNPMTRSGNSPVFNDELVILGYPVYSGRLPTEAANHLMAFRAGKTPAVLVAVYGNRAYEDALKELHELVVKAGFTPIAGGAFIGEHSFSSKKVSIAHGRPDVSDLQKAREFGAKIQEKLRRINSLDDIGTLHVPGNFPYRKIIHLPKTAPSTRTDLCTQCGKCVELCPTGAIDRDAPARTDERKCLLCHACIKTCPAGARSMKNIIVKTVARVLSKHCQCRKEPEFFT